MAAGLAAAERAGGLFLGLESPERMGQAVRQADAILGSSETELRVAPLPPGKDPDEIARDDPDTWRRAIEDAPPFAEFLLRRVMDAQPVDSPSQAREIVDRLKPVLIAVRDPLERAVYVQRVARHLGISEDAVVDRLRAGSRPQFQPRQREQAAPLSQEEVLLAILLKHRTLRQAFRNYPPSLFTGALEREIFVRWLRDDAAFGRADDEDPVTERARLLEARRLPPLSENEARQAAQEKVREILRERIVMHQAARSEDLAEAERRLGANRVAELAMATWRGAMPSESDRILAEAVIEELQLGLSLHRKESPNGV